MVKVIVLDYFVKATAINTPNMHTFSFLGFRGFSKRISTCKADWQRAASCWRGVRAKGNREEGKNKEEMREKCRRKEGIEESRNGDRIATISSISCVCWMEIALDTKVLKS